MWRDEFNSFLIWQFVLLALFPARVKELGASAKTDLARGCGYVVKKKDGDEQVKFTHSV